MFTDRRINSPWRPGKRVVKGGEPGCAAVRRWIDSEPCGTPVRMSLSLGKEPPVWAMLLRGWLEPMASFGANLVSYPQKVR